jgi:formylmethanofuran dehydrogenase subunit B
LCDDIELHVEGDRITDARNACAPARERFLGFHPAESPACLIDGHPAGVEEGVERAARILAAARCAVIFGLGETTCEAQRAAASLADRIGACLDVATGEASTMALQDVGEVTCTLGEIRNRGDLIIVWGADPVESHPRLFSRYALDPKGEFLPGGRGDRYCVIVDVHETKSVREAADEFIAINEDGSFEALWTLRALAKDVELDATQVETATGVPLATWRKLMDRMKAARYGVLFYAAEALTPSRGHAVAHAVHSLIRDVNAHTRFVGMPLGGPGNEAGAHNVLAWRTGYPFAVSLVRGFPRYGPGEFTASDLLRRGEADAALIVSGDPVPRLPEEARAHLSRIPRIVLKSQGDPLIPGADVVFHTATHGISTSGTVFRMDGVPLPLRPVVASPLPSDHDVLRAIERRVGSDATPAPDGAREVERCP